jgi:diguanylate cyclase (GGDEF)-like protein
MMTILPTYPLHADDDDRISRVQALRLVDEPDAALDRICALAKTILDVPMVFVSVLGRTRQYLPNRIGMPMAETARDAAFCNYPIADGQTLIVSDTHNDARFCDSPLVAQAPFLRSYVGVPLVLEGGMPLATLCCTDIVPRDFTPAQLHALSSLASLAEVQLRSRQTTLAFASSHTHDWLTGLENRQGFYNHLDKAIAAAADQARHVGLLIIDMDNFKHVNDTGGRDVGDTVLRCVAKILRNRVPASAIAARIDGDQFAVLLPVLEQAPSAEALGSDLVGALSDIFGAGTQTNSRASIGLSIYPDHAAESAALVRAADLAMYAAKDAGGNRVVRYAPELTSQSKLRAAMLSRAHSAILHSQVVPYYQPKIALSTGRVAGFEALLRLQGPNGIEMPRSVEAAFADPRLSVQLSTEMLSHALEDMRGWQAADIPFGSVAINVTEFDLRNNLGAYILDRLQKAGLPPSSLQVEVTEKVFLGRNAELISLVLRDLSEKGIAVALDDFGTGYASLSHLRQFCVDWVKLDRSFVRDMNEDGKAAAIVHGVISIAQGLGIGVVAEGVETRQQVQLLQRRHCDLGQGYLFAQPLPAAGVPEFLRSWSGIPGPVHAPTPLESD